MHDAFFAVRNSTLQPARRRRRAALVLAAALLLLPLLMAACRAAPPPPDLVRWAYAAALQAHWQEVFAVHQAAQSTQTAPSAAAPDPVTDPVSNLPPAEPPAFLAAYQLDRGALPQLPTAVQDAHAFYLRSVEARDWGNVYLFAVPILGMQTYAVRTTTDGDDGWLEVYATDGALLGAARTYIELVAWEDVTTLRAQTATGAFPPALADRHTRTLWR